MPAPIIRGMESGDAAQVAALMERATAELRRLYRPRGERAAGPEVRDAGRAVAVRQGSVIGVVEFLPAPEAWHLRGLAVEEAWRRCGVARALVEHVARAAQAAGATRLTLTTIGETGNPALFRRLGFEAVEERVAPAFESPAGGAVVQVGMARDLTRPVPRHHG